MERQDVKNSKISSAHNSPVPAGSIAFTSVGLPVRAFLLPLRVRGDRAVRSGQRHLAGRRPIAPLYSPEPARL